MESGLGRDGGWPSSLPDAGWALVDGTVSTSLAGLGLIYEYSVNSATTIDLPATSTGETVALILALCTEPAVTTAEASELTTESSSTTQETSTTLEASTTPNFSTTDSNTPEASASTTESTASTTESTASTTESTASTTESTKISSTTDSEINEWTFTLVVDNSEGVTSLCTNLGCETLADVYECEAMCLGNSTCNVFNYCPEGATCTSGAGRCCTRNCPSVAMEDLDLVDTWGGWDVYIKQEVSHYEEENNSWEYPAEWSTLEYYQSSYELPSSWENDECIEHCLLHYDTCEDACYFCWDHSSCIDNTWGSTDQCIADICEEETTMNPSETTMDPSETTKKALETTKEPSEATLETTLKPTEPRATPEPTALRAPITSEPTVRSADTTPLPTSSPSSASARVCLNDCATCQDNQDPCLWNFDTTQDKRFDTFDCNDACNGKSSAGSNSKDDSRSFPWIMVSAFGFLPLLCILGGCALYTRENSKVIELKEMVDLAESDRASIQIQSPKNFRELLGKQSRMSSQESCSTRTLQGTPGNPDVGTPELHSSGCVE